MSIGVPYTTLVGWLDGVVPNAFWAEKIIATYPQLRDFPNWQPLIAPRVWKVRRKEILAATKRKIALLCEENWLRFEESRTRPGAPDSTAVDQLRAQGTTADGPGVAESLRKLINAGSAPLRSVADSLEAAGVPVVGIEEISQKAVVSLATSGATAICVAVVNGHEIGDDDLRYGLAQELGFCLVSDARAAGKLQAVRAFADALLIPSESLTKMVIPDKGGRVTQHVVELLCQFYGAPTGSVIRSLSGLEIKAPEDFVGPPVPALRRLSSHLRLRAF